MWYFCSPDMVSRLRSTLFNQGLTTPHAGPQTIFLLFFCYTLIGKSREVLFCWCETFQSFSPDTVGCCKLHRNILFVSGALLTCQSRLNSLVYIYFRTFMFSVGPHCPSHTSTSNLWLGNQIR